MILATPIPLEMTCAMQRAMVEAASVPLSALDTKRIYSALVTEGLRHDYDAAKGRPWTK